MGRRRATPAGAPEVVRGQAKEPTRTLASFLSEGQCKDCLVALAGENPSAGKKTSTVYADELKVLSRKQVLELCSAMLEAVQSAVQALYPDEEVEKGPHVDELEALTLHLSILKGSALLAYDILEETIKQGGVPESLTQTAILLHDNCIMAMVEAQLICQPVIKLCSRWYELGGPDKNFLVSQTLPTLLNQALVGKPADVKLVYSLREGYALFDYSDDSSRQLKMSLLKASMTGRFLRLPEGRRFISSCYQLYPELIPELVTSMKHLIQGGKKWVLDAYGDILFRAWRDSLGGPLQYDIEAYAVQELMRVAINASTLNLAAFLRTVLAAFHKEKKMAGVESMLCRLYEPILFRAFGATNTNIRYNALLLLLDAFPIRDPDAPPEEMDESMTRQFQILQDCLTDSCPMVRESAAKGVITLLNDFWELTPTAVTALFMSKLLSDVAYDMSWPGVRIAVLKRLTNLIDNPHAQPLLKKALPQLGSLLGDPNLKVREQMSRLLLAVSLTRGLHFYDIIPLDHLLSVLACDDPCVSANIQALLLPTYFPDPHEGSLNVVNLLKAQPQAGQAFCRYLVSSFRVAAESEQEGEDDGDEHMPAGLQPSVPLEQVLVLVGALMQHMLATCCHLKDSLDTGVTKKRKASKAKATQAAAGRKRKPGSAAGDPASEQVPETEATEQLVDAESETPATWCSWAAGLAALVQGVSGAVSQELCGTDDVEKVVESDMLTLMYEAAPNQAARCSIMQVASLLPFLPASAALRSLIINQLAAGNPPPADPAPAGTGAKAAGPAAAQDSWLQAALRCVCAGASGPKMVNMLLKAFGLRTSSTIYVPVGSAAAKATAEQQEEAEDDDEGADIKCGACGCSEPEDSLLLCDGCDAAYHMGCMRPVMSEVPRGDWFCHTCEQEIQQSSITAGGAARCLDCVLAWREGRRLLYSNSRFSGLLAGLQGLAVTHCQRLVRQLNNPSHPAITKAPATEPSDEAQEAPAKGKRSKVSKVGKAAGAAAAVAPAETTVGSAVQEVNVTRVYCQAALHLALKRLLGSSKVDAGKEEEEEEEQSEEARQQDLTASASALLESLELCEQVMEACLSSSAGPAAKQAALQVVAEVLGVVADAHSLNILDATLGGDVAQVHHVCSLCGHITDQVAQLLGAGTEQADQQPEPDVVALARGALGPVLTLSNHLVSSQGCRPSNSTAAGQQAEEHAEGQEAGAAGGPQQLEARLHEAADTGVAGPVSWEVVGAVDGLLTPLLHLLHTWSDSSRPASAQLLTGHVRQLTANLIAKLLDPACKVPTGWLSRLMSTTGATDLDTADTAGTSKASDLGPGADGDGDGPRLGDITNTRPARGGKGKPKGKQAISGRKRKGDAAAAAAEAEADAGAGQGEQAEGGGQEEEEEHAAGGKQMVAGQYGLTGLLLGACKTKDYQDQLLDHVARAACESWRSPVCLGSLAFMKQLGVQGLRGRRLRLTGYEANLLIKLEMLAAEVTAASDEARDARDEGQDVAAVHAAEEACEQAGKVMTLLTSIMD